MGAEMKNNDLIRHKLNEHIVYLQNEVRKRDDMLDDNYESDSEFDLVSNNSYDELDSSPNKKHRFNSSC